MVEPENMTTNVVSFDSEELILVDADDHAIGHENKALCHDGHGILHRAFSLFVFNGQGELLLQQRAADKRLWPGYWANSCCSHPRLGESVEQASGRRLREELGIGCDMSFVYKFIYQADYQDLGAEHELCHVYVGQSDDPVRPNRTEVGDWRFVAPEALDQELADHPERFTPWLQMEWRELRGRYRQRLPQAAMQA